ncbi:ubiquitinyl hydrolase 1 [Trifolium repens]|nr:ubiquitinyl hydrolase 1 [Trifolium repens]
MTLFRLILAVTLFLTFFITLSQAFQSDELLLDDEEFGLEGGRPQSRQSPNIATTTTTTTPTRKRIPLPIPRSSSHSNTILATLISPKPVTSPLVSKLGATALRSPLISYTQTLNSVFPFDSIQIMRQKTEFHDEVDLVRHLTDFNTSLSLRLSLSEASSWISFFRFQKPLWKRFLKSLAFGHVESGLDLCPIAPPEKTKDGILLFFKLNDPEKEELHYVGRLFVNGTGKPSAILARLNKIARYDPDEEIGLYEEIKFEPNVMCEPIDKKLTFRASQLEERDIICFLKAPTIDNVEHRKNKTWVDRRSEHIYVDFCILFFELGY